MRNGATIAVVIPAFNEEASIGRVLQDIPDWVDDIVVADNGSTDKTADVVRANGARVVHEPERGYGAACLAGIAALKDPDTVVFLDGDYSDHPEEMDRLVDPILERNADMVVGSRILGNCEPGSLTPQARYGNWLACTLMKLFWGVRHTDLGPFRAIRNSTLCALNMQDRNFGWTVEMQVKAAQRGVRSQEVPVSYRKRIGRSKISGTVKGVIAAGTKILYTIFREALTRPHKMSNVSRDYLGIFTRYPESGKTKTRLIPALGPEGAAELQAEMAAHTVTTGRQARQHHGIALSIFYDGGDEDRMHQWLGPDLAYICQEGEDLGERMHNAFVKAFHSGAHRAVLIGIDCPEITPQRIDESLRALNEHDVVVGPVDDGGYYLIGLCVPVRELFSGIDWGTSEVLEKTLKTAADRGLSVAQLATLRDVDRPEDIQVWESSNQKKELSNGPPITVIIPTLDEERTVGDTLASARQAPGIEIIVADGRSTDATRSLAETYGAKVIVSKPGRCYQMNAAAEVAQGEILLFLHADTILPSDYDQIIRNTFLKPDTVAGAFRFRLDAVSPTLRVIERGTNLRARRFQWPYGDQAIFTSTQNFREVGGYLEIPIMEDYELVRRLRKLGQIRLAEESVVTSARRWLATGSLRLTLKHQIIIAAYRLGVSPDRLARWR